MIISKGKQSYKKKDTDTQLPIAVGATRISFMHLAMGGETSLDLYALSAPTSAVNLGFVQPGVQTLLAANIYQNRNNLNLTRNSTPLVPFVDYVVLSNSKISFLSFTAAPGDVFYGSITPIVASGLNVVSGQVINTTGTLAVGATEFTVSVPFETNKYPGSQIGAVLVYRDGVLQMRNTGNVTADPSADGNYQEVPGANGMSTVIKFNSPSVISSSAIIVISNGLLVNNPTDSLQSQIESISNVANNAYNEAMSVDTNQIVDSAVTEPKIAADSVTTTKIKDLNVTGAKLKDASVSYAKLASDVTNKFVASYIANGSAEVDTAGWLTYNDGGATPTDGIGGSPQTNLWIRNTSSPLRGAASFNLSKTGSASRIGQGVAYDFTIEKADQAKVLSISFDYEVLTGTYANNDIAVWVYDKTNLAMIQPAGYQLKNVAIGTRNKFIATFQTAFNSTSYRLCLHIASNSALDYSLGIDNVIVSQQNVIVGEIKNPVGTIISFGSLTPPRGYLYCDGSAISRSQFSDLFSAIGTTYGSGDGSTTFNIPDLRGIFARGAGTQTINGITYSRSLDGTKQGDQYQGHTHGVGSTISGSGGIVYLQPPGLSNDQPGGYVTKGNFNDGTNGTPRTGSETRPANQAVAYHICFSSGNVQLSDSTDTRVVAAHVHTTSAQTVSNSVYTKFVPTNIEYDTHGAFSIANSRYICPVPGFYRITGAVSFNASPIGIRSLALYQNGSIKKTMGEICPSSNNTTAVSGATVVYCNAGDYLEAFIWQGSGSNLNTYAGQSSSWLSFERLSGPSTIAASETVAMSCMKTATQSIGPGGTVIILNWDSPMVDTHGAFVNSTGVYTVPVSGIYDMYAFIMYSPFAATASAEMYIMVDGSAVAYDSDSKNTNGSSTFWCTKAQATLRLVAGQKINVVVQQNSGASRSTYNAYNTLQIKRIGN